MKLTPKQEAFAQAYIETGNASEAYRRAYNVSPKTKPNTVEKRACELLKHGKVAGRIAELQAAHQKRHEITVDRIITEYAKIAFADAGDYFDWGPDGVTVKSKSELTPEQRAAVAEVCQTVTEKGGTIRVKLHDKQTALAALGKHLGMFIDKQEITGKNGGPIETRELSDREFARWLALKLQRAALNGSANGVAKNGHAPHIPTAWADAAEQRAARPKR